MKAEEYHWKKKHDHLQTKIRELLEKSEYRQLEDIPKDCISGSLEFWMSNDMEVVDTEKAAIRLFGEGKYFKVVKVASE